MNGAHHRVLAAATWCCVTVAQHRPGWEVAAGAVVAVAFSAGPTSPDLDNTRMWRKIDRWTPDEELGEGGPLGHRQLLHWWAIPFLVAVAAFYADLGVVAWAVWAAVLGWSSHLAGDFVFGQSGFGTRRGIPLGPWWCHVGAGLKSGGVAEYALTWPIVLALAWVALGAPGVTG